MTEEREELSCECQEIHEDLLKIVNETMPDEEELYDLADLFKVFADSEYDTVRSFPSASHPEAEQAGEEPQRRKIYFLFPCR